MSNFISRFAKHPNFFQLITLTFLSLTFIIYATHALNDVLDPFILSFILSYFINKGIRKFEHKLSRTYLSLLFILVISGIFVLSILFFFPYLKTQFNALIVEIPNLTDKTYKNIHKKIMSHQHSLLHQSEIKSYVINTLPKIMDHASIWITDLISHFLSNGLEIANKLSIVFFTPIITFYMSKDWHKIELFLKKIIPLNIKTKTLSILSEIDLKITNYIKGQFIICLFLAILYSSSLTLIGLPNAITIGVTTGILSFIPYFGFFVGFISALAISFFYFTGWWQIIEIVAVFNIIALIEMNFLLPRFIGNHLGVSPIWIIFSILSTAQILGFCWIALSIPFLCIFKVCLSQFFQNQLINQPSP